MRRTTKFLTAIFAVAILVFACAGREGRTGPIRDLIRERLQDRTGQQDRAGQSAARTSGTEEVAVTVDGRQRSFLVRVPPGFDPSRRYPAVLVFHGGGGDVEQVQRSSGMSQAADSRGFVAVYPMSPDSQWNDGRATTESPKDDVGYVRAILNELRANWAVDPDRVFAAGMSNGGMFVQRLACEMPGEFAAFAAVAANMPAELANRCSPSAAGPMMFFSGTADPIMPFEGGEIARGRLLRVGAGGQVLSTERTLDFWSRINDCDSAASRNLPDRVNDETNVVRIDYSGCEGGPIVYYRIEGGGHAWPGIEAGRGRRITGPATQDISATAEMLEFFRNFGL